MTRKNPEITFAWQLKLISLGLIALGSFSLLFFIFSIILGPHFRGANLCPLMGGAGLLTLANFFTLGYLRRFKKPAYFMAVGLMVVPVVFFTGLVISDGYRWNVGDFFCIGVGIFYSSLAIGMTRKSFRERFGNQAFLCQK